jgi:hypothetical protein
MRFGEKFSNFMFWISIAFLIFTEAVLLIKHASLIEHFVLNWILAINLICVLVLSVFSTRTSDRQEKFKGVSKVLWIGSLLVFVEMLIF